ncbi:hypothetical protein IW261DRAFT_788334 [Armillaria novae-zelandiae]|uniref:Uncharacterized protein n=1 Tax=Armillaria novae-zelandiae TaxID=153914 RepID=A0AA39PL14_9AGAR|nr:hypothetical protein IW261DRAFT_788334 [Armillaria novae-zelandiae]
MDSNHPEIELCTLLGQMNLVTVQESYPAEPEVIMVDDTSCDSDASSDPGFMTPELRHNGCAYLQALQAQLDSYPTTGGEYLEAIFTHREILACYPGAHQLCAQGFSDLAYALEQRAWRADREADTEAVVAFRHEAWMIASTLWVLPLSFTTLVTAELTFHDSIYRPASPPSDAIKEFTYVDSTSSKSLIKCMMPLF